jgi:hypothetical protein
MGARARLRSSFDCNALVTKARVVCVAMQKYGLILADVGTSWFITGEASSGWGQVVPNFAAFKAELSMIKGRDMQIVMPPGEALLLPIQCND